MKHYKISKGTNGWTKAEVTRPDGTKVEYENFYNRSEAEDWCYGWVNYYYGPATAKREF